MSDTTIVLPSMPGYKVPAKHVVDNLQNEGFLQARSPGNTRYSIHEILSRKMREWIDSDTQRRAQLLNLAHASVVTGFVNFDQFTSSESQGEGLRPFIGFCTAMHAILKGLESCGHINNATERYNSYLNLREPFHNAKSLARQLGGRVDIRLNPLSTTECRISPRVTVQELDRSKAFSLAREHGGKVAVALDQATNDHIYMINFDFPVNPW